LYYITQTKEVRNNRNIIINKYRALVNMSLLDLLSMSDSLWFAYIFDKLLQIHHGFANIIISLCVNCSLICQQCCDPKKTIQENYHNHWSLIVEFWVNLSNKIHRKLKTNYWLILFIIFSLAYPFWNMVNCSISKKLSIAQKLSQFSYLYLCYYFTYYICINSTIVFRLFFSVPL